MAKMVILVAIFAFVVWSLYTIYRTEGFQNSSESPSERPSGMPSGNASKCDMMIPVYKSLEERYNNAVNRNMTDIIDTSFEAMNSMKQLLISMNCPV